MPVIDQFRQYLLESKNDNEEKINQLSNFIFKNNLVNIIYEIEKSNSIAKIFHIGASNQLIDVLNYSVSSPLRSIEMDLTETPAIKRVYLEKKAIYFRNVPAIASELIPAIKFPQRFNLVLKKMGVSELAVLPLFFQNHAFSKECILVVLGPLSEEQRKFVKEASNEIINYINNKN